MQRKNKLILIGILMVLLAVTGFSRPTVSSSAPEIAGTYIPGKGRYFDGSDYLDLSSPIDMSGSTTVELWVRLDGDVDNHSRVGVILGTFGNNNNDAMINYELHEDGKPRIYWDNGAVDLIGNTPLRDGKWHHVAFTHEAVEYIELVDGKFISQTYHHVMIYVDGILDENAVVPADRYSLEDPQFSVGGDYRPSGVPYFNGFMDELRLWNKVLSASEIQSLAAANVPADTTNLIHYFPMDNDAVGITDVVGNLTGNQPAGTENDPEFMHFTREVTNFADQQLNSQTRCLVNQCSLRAAIAEDIPRNEKVTFSADGAGQVIWLQHGELALDNVLTIDGANAPKMLIDAQGNSRIFEVTASDSTIKSLTLIGGDAGSGWGGAIHIEENAALTLLNSTLNGNTASNGGAIANEGTLNMRNSTITGNTAQSHGGALFQAGGVARIDWSTLAGNRSTTSVTDGIRVDGGGNVVISSSILEHDRQSCSRVGSSSLIASSGYNILNDGGNHTNCNLNEDTDQTVDPLLGSFANHGGNTSTYAIPFNSPAIDSVPSNTLGCGSFGDQRGVGRPNDGNEDGTPACDVGAFEFEPFTSCNSGDIIGIPVSECEALVALYDSTAGENWNTITKWKQTNLPCGWAWVACEDGHIISLNLSSENMTGAIPAEIGNLTQLKTLWLNDNQLTGSIPAEIGNLTQLKTLWLDNNQLTGSIPAELGDLPNLSWLDLYDNQFLGGAIPASFMGKNFRGQFNFYNTRICEPAGLLETISGDVGGTGLACPTVKMSTADVTVAENEGVAEIAVQLSTTSTLPITLTYSTVNGVFSPGPSLATAGSDYTAAVNQPLVVPAGQSIATLSIPIIDDGAVEQNEHFVVELSLADNLAGAMLVPLQDFTTVQITDNDEPGSTNNAPTANGQSVTTAQGEAKTITLTGSDADDDTLTYIIVSQPASGTLSGSAPNVTYTPDAGFSGSDTFTFKVNDGKADSGIATVTINVADAPTSEGTMIFLPLIVR